MKSACLHIEEAVNRTCMLAVDCFFVAKCDSVVFVGVVVSVFVSFVVVGVDVSVFVSFVVVLGVVIVVVLLGVVVGTGVVDALDGSVVVVVLMLNVDEGIGVDLGKSGSPLQLRVRRTLGLSTFIKEHDTC